MSIYLFNVSQHAKYTQAKESHTYVDNDDNNDCYMARQWQINRWRFAPVSVAETCTTTKSIQKMEYNQIVVRFAWLAFNPTLCYVFYWLMARVATEEKAKGKRINAYKMYITQWVILTPLNIQQCMYGLLQCCTHNTLMQHATHNKTHLNRLASFGT